ncbi:ABC transporter ATP-binding protein [Desulfosarcina ovata]|uniref:ABC transporter ATP-binding protein n=2 Tax=Desulfosarcina ovata TaxID=83564 RepID=A0A5K8ANF0_9BACT|nr:ABC transporter ATP-binding protein [Desulfosarcina ovata]BBO86202.1 ABC transporter ATP-binding protein [Desulfosarcina ovata subsp. sediminis]BBO93154.1 ABC transporter ATP-binding protein [Desulfosarcina ovata subsp. ovata]
MTGRPVLQVTDLSKSFGGIRAVDTVSFRLQENEILGVIGPNGSGKTTLANLITRFVRPSAGSVHFMGRPIHHLPAHKIVRLGIARTFQMVRPFYRLPAYKNMIVSLYSPRVTGFLGGRCGNRSAVALDLLEEVGFERDARVAYQDAGGLPQGYLKRLELAKAIALRPRLIILDELFSGLSLAEVTSLTPIIEKLRQQGKAIIMIEHRLKELFKIADRVIVMDNGRKIADGRCPAVMADQTVQNAYLGADCESLPRPGNGISDD